MTPDQMRKKIRHGKGWLGHKHGKGSTPEAVAPMQDWFPTMVENLGIRTVADVGCGNSDWFPKHCCEYQGFDLVPQEPEAIELDITTTKLPDRYDLIVMRYVLNHLSNKNTRRALDNILHRSTYFLISNFERQETEWRTCKERLYPIQGMRLLDTFPDHDGRKNKRMELYRNDPTS